MSVPYFQGECGKKEEALGLWKDHPSRSVSLGELQQNST